MSKYKGAGLAWCPIVNVLRYNIFYIVLIYFDILDCGMY